MKAFSVAIAIQILTTGLMLHCLDRQATAAPAFQALESQPLYRFRSSKGYSSYHTKPTLPQGLSDGPWKNEGIVCYVPNYNRQIETKRVYELLKSDVIGNRFAYTTNSGEAQGGWSMRGVAFHVVTKQQLGTVPLYRLYLPLVIDGEGKAFSGPRPGTDAHFYTTSEHERDNALKNKWVSQGILGYVWLAPYPPPDDPLPDITIQSANADEFSVTAILMNKGKANTGGVKYEVTLSVFDEKGKLILKTAKVAPGLSPNQRNQIIFNTQGKSLHNTRYQLRVDSTNVLEESDESNNETAMLDGPRRKIDLSQVDTERVTPPSIEMTDKQESGTKERPRIIYVFSVWTSYPAEWFQPLKSLPPTFCAGESTNARMLVHIWIEAGGPPQKAGCKVLNSPQDLKSVQTLPIGGALPKPDKVFVVLEDRLAGKRYQSNSYPVEVFGVDKELSTVGCKRLLGRASDFVCTKKLGFDACENLKKQGKPINCRLAGK